MRLHFLFCYENDGWSCVSLWSMLFLFLLMIKGENVCVSLCYICAKYVLWYASKYMDIWQIWTYDICDMLQDIWIYGKYRYMIYMANVAQYFMTHAGENKNTYYISICYNLFTAGGVFMLRLSSSKRGRMLKLTDWKILIMDNKMHLTLYL